MLSWDIAIHRTRSTWFPSKRQSSIPCRVEASQGGEYLPIRKRRRKEIGPRLDLTREEAVQLQLAVRLLLSETGLGVIWASICL